MITSQVQCWRCYRTFPKDECTEIGPSTYPGDEAEYECRDCTQAMTLARYVIEVEMERNRDRMLRESIVVTFVIIVAMAILGYILS